MQQEGAERFTKSTAQSAPEMAPETPLQKKYHKGDLQSVQAHNAGDYASTWRSALGQRLQRELRSNKKTKNGYLSAADKDQWKKDWCKKQYKGAIVRMRTYTTASQESWLSKGKVVSFLRMRYEEGGPRGHWDPEAMQDCAVIAQRCIRMGFPFVQVDEQHGKVKFTWFSHEYSDKFEKRWEETQKQNMDKALTDDALIALPRARMSGSGDDAAEDTAADPEDPAEDPAEGPEADPEADPDEDPGQHDSAPPKPGKKEKSPAAIALAHCRKMIAAMQSTLASAKSLSEDIAEDASKGGGDGSANEAEPSEWAWARTAAVQGTIDTMIKDIEGTIKKNKLWQKLLIGTEVSQVRKEFKEADIEVLCEKDAVDTLQDLRKRGAELNNKIQATIESHRALQNNNKKPPKKAKDPTIKKKVKKGK
ncbi:unnamed protein product [Prorocentrum cordatum]|uniref:Uncharacterized protein n=1 Tax=Prorocentrum cordatum TaxID=2364126 RepID=A0ABN9WEB8_9DINO|nr:unnamed protein product [Polarella glacialis]